MNMAASSDPPAEAVPASETEAPAKMKEDTAKEPEMATTATTCSEQPAESTKVLTEATTAKADTAPVAKEEANTVTPAATTAPTPTLPTANNDATSTAIAPSSTSTAAATQKDDDVNPPDFQGEVETNNKLPSQETLRKLEDHTVLDADGKSHTFKSLYAGHNTARRVLIIFVRHFFCGNCQEYLRILSTSITPEALLRLPVSTFICVIGCGTPELIRSYIEETNCPFPLYADPTRRLYSELGMVRTLAMGQRPAYMQNRTLAQTIVSGVVQGLKQVKSGLALKSGDQRQVGGEFLFEPASMTLETPITTPEAVDDKNRDGFVEEKRVTWCHRMRTTRDHVEIPELMEVLGLDGKGMPMPDFGKRWEKALKQRKGTGLSLASQMSRMSVDAKAAETNGKDMAAKA